MLGPTPASLGGAIPRIPRRSLSFPGPVGRPLGGDTDRPLYYRAGEPGPLGWLPSGAPSARIRVVMASTIIGPELSIDGDLTSEEDVRIEGRVLGRVTTQGAVDVGPGGQVTSEVTGRTVNVAGTVTASVNASERVDLLAGGRLIGDVKAPRLTIADGATFRGKVDMEA